MGKNFVPSSGDLFVDSMGRLFFFSEGCATHVAWSDGCSVAYYLGTRTYASGNFLAKHLCRAEVCPMCGTSRADDNLYWPDHEANGISCYGADGDS